MPRSLRSWQKLVTDYQLNALPRYTLWRRALPRAALASSSAIVVKCPVSHPHRLNLRHHTSRCALSPLRLKTSSGTRSSSRHKVVPIAASSALAALSGTILMNVVSRSAGCGAADCDGAESVLRNAVGCGGGSDDDGNGGDVSTGGGCDGGEGGGCNRDAAAAWCVGESTGADGGCGTGRSIHPQRSLRGRPRGRLAAGSPIHLGSQQMR